jgi:hypothetical protein
MAKLVVINITLQIKFIKKQKGPTFFAELLNIATGDGFYLCAYLETAQNHGV